MNEEYVFKITLRFFSILKNITGKKEIELTIGEQDDTLHGALFKICKEYGKHFQEFMFKNETSQLNPNLIILINDIDVNLLNGLDTRLIKGDVITIFPTIHGGAT
ncbi:MAG: MoaD/ThiS family protein [Candidatus Helarchaeota archaeon]